MRERRCGRPRRTSTMSRGRRAVAWTSAPTNGDRGRGPGSRGRRAPGTGLMRFAVISDVHANLHALDAALAFLATQDVDGYLCAGDLVGYGPFPNECVRRVAALGGPCVAGNHDLIAIGRLSDERCIPLAQASLRWTS